MSGSYEDMEREIWNGAEPVDPQPNEIETALKDFRKTAEELAQLMGDMMNMINQRFDAIEKRVGNGQKP